MRIQHINKALMVSFLTKQALELVGGFGIGKSSVIRDFAQMLETTPFAITQPDGSKLVHKKGEPVGLIECLVPTYAVEDIRGFPMPDYKKGEMFYSIPPFFPNSRKYPEGIPKFGIIFLDEYRLGPDEVVKATTQLLLEGRIGDHSLSEYGHWVVFAASNREEDRVGIGKEAPIVTQRKMVIEMEPDLQALLDWMERHETGEHGVPAFPPAVRFFAKDNPGLVIGAETPDDGKPFCTPRTLVQAGQLLNQYMTLTHFKPANRFDVPVDDFSLELLASKIGEGAAAQLQTYARLIGQVPAYEDIMKTPDTAQLPDPERLDAAHCTIQVIEHQAGDWSRDPDGEIDTIKLEQEVDALVTYLMRLPSEFQVVGIRRTFKRCPALYAHPKIREIAKSNPSVLKAIS